MAEIRTNQFSITFKEVVLAQKIYNRAILRKERRKDFIVIVFVALVVMLAAISPLALAALLIPQVRPGLLPSFLAAEQSLAQFYFWPFVILLLLAYVLSPLANRFHGWRHYQANRNGYEDLQTVFTDKGIDFISPNATSHCDWSYFQSVIDQKKCFVLVWGKDNFTPIPKRALLESQIPALTEMLRNHISNYASGD